MKAEQTHRRRASRHKQITKETHQTLVSTTTFGHLNPQSKDEIEE